MILLPSLEQREGIEYQVGTYYRQRPQRALCRLHFNIIPEVFCFAFACDDSSQNPACVSYNFPVYKSRPIMRLSTFQKHLLINTTTVMFLADLSGVWAQSAREPCNGKR
jgi:hypothetical protein